MLTNHFLLLVLIPGIGKEVNGSRRWIDLGFFTVQVSETVKLFIIVYLAGYLVRRGYLVQKYPQYPMGTTTQPDAGAISARG